MKKYKIYDSAFNDVYLELTKKEIREKLEEYLKHDRFDVEIVIGQCQEFGEAWITHDEFLKL